MPSFIKPALAGAAGIVAIIGSAQAGVIFSDSFEGDTPAKWRVYGSTGDTGGWVTVSGAGIEIQNESLGITEAADGAFYVELDSHNGNGGAQGVSTNTTMAAAVAFVAGRTYEISFAYQPRTNNGGDDNGINLMVGNLNGTAFTATSVLLSLAKTANEQPGWETFSVLYKAMTDINAIGFGAFGNANSLGGFIDAVSVNAVETPLPAAALMFATGIVGAGAARRRRAASKR